MGSSPSKKKRKISTKPTTKPLAKPLAKSATLPVKQPISRRALKKSHSTPPTNIPLAACWFWQSNPNP